MFQIGLDGEGVAWLVRLGLLAENQRSDRGAVKDAFVQLAAAGFREIRSGSRRCDDLTRRAPIVLIGLREPAAVTNVSAFPIIMQKC